MKIIGRLAWDDANHYQTPWCEFANITEFRTWCRDMSKAQGKPGNKLKAEYITIPGLWTPEGLLWKVRKDNARTS